MNEFAPRTLRSPDSSISRNAVGYLRRSTDRQEQSLADQRRAIEDFAVLHRLKILRYYTDDAISGTNTSRRKAFLEMIAAAQQSPATFAHIIVYDVKHFGRVDNDEAGYFHPV